MSQIRNIEDIEIELYHFIKDLFQEIKAKHPQDGLNSPRDIELAKEINKKSSDYGLYARCYESH